MNKYIYLVIVLALSLSNTAFGQVIKGTVQDEKHNKIKGAYLNIKDLRSNKDLWNGQSDSLAQFTIPATIKQNDSIVLIAWNYEYEIYTMPFINIGKSLDIVLKGKSLQLDSVVFEAKHNPIRFYRGDLIVDVKKVKNFERLSSTELISRLSGLSIIDGVIYLNGRPAVVYMNGSKQTIPASAVMKYLESLPAASLSEIKLIPMPSVKYGKVEAVIDINMDTKMLDGIFLSSSVYSSILDKELGHSGLNNFFLIKKGNITFNTTLDYDNIRNWSNGSDSVYIAIPKVSLLSDSKLRGRTGSLRSNSNLTIDLKNNNHLDFNLYLYGDQTNNNNNWSTKQTSVLDKYYKSKIKENEDIFSFTAKFSTDPKKAHSLQAYYSGSYGKTKTQGDYFLKDKLDVYDGYLYTDYDKKGYLHNVTIDGTSNLMGEKLQLEYGLSGDLGLLNSSTDNYNSITSVLENSSKFKGSELILNSYFIARYNFSDNKGLSLNFGFSNTNYKYTENGGESKRSYNDFVPQIKYWYNTNKYRLSLMLKTYLNRPDYSSLIPGEKYYNDYFYTKGNPDIKNRIAYSIQLHQTFWDFLNLQMATGLAKNIFTSYYAIDGNNKMYRTAANLGDNVYMNLILDIPYKLLSGKLYGSFNCASLISHIYNIDPAILKTVKTQDNVKLSYGGQINYDITDRLTINTTFRGQGNDSFAQYTNKNYTSVSAGIWYSFLKDKNLTLAFAATNFISDINNSSLTYRFDSNYVSQYSDRPFFCKFKLTYRFRKGNKNVDVKDNMADMSRMK